MIHQRSRWRRGCWIRSVTTTRFRSAVDSSIRSGPAPGELHVRLEFLPLVLQGSVVLHQNGLIGDVLLVDGR